MILHQLICRGVANFGTRCSYNSSTVLIMIVSLCLSLSQAPTEFFAVVEHCGAETPKASRQCQRCGIAALQMPRGVSLGRSFPLTSRVQYGEGSVLPPRKILNFFVNMNIMYLLSFLIHINTVMYFVSLNVGSQLCARCFSIWTYYTLVEDKSGELVMLFLLVITAPLSHILLFLLNRFIFTKHKQTIVNNMSVQPFIIRSWNSRAPFWCFGGFSPFPRLRPWLPGTVVCISPCFMLVVSCALGAVCFL